MPMIAIDPNWGAIFCCDGAGGGDVCDAWCENADPVVAEQFIRAQHLGYVDMSCVGGPYLCDDSRCCGEEEED